MPHCKLPNCPVAKDGRCLEGKKSDCPNLIEGEAVRPRTSTDVNGGPQPVPSLTAKDTVLELEKTEPLYSGLPLEVNEAREFTRRSRASVVALAGLIESGKTSLIARIHQQFQRGPIGEFCFRESKTLFRFEEMNWKSTVASGATKPSMDHSSRRFNNSFLHVTVRRNSGELVDLLVNDISGEAFSDAITMQSFCNDLLCVRRADHFVVLVDGNAISKPDFDQIAKSRNIIQRFLQSGQIGKHTILHLVITKLDVLNAPETAKDNLDLAENVIADFKKRFSGEVADFYSWRLAASPKDGSLPTEDEIAKMFLSWLKLPTVSPSISQSAVPTRFSRDFCAFTDSQ